MAFDDVKKSIEWADDGGRVFAYFTAHFGRAVDDPVNPDKDTAQYAMGWLSTESGRLVGDLATVYTNTDVAQFSLEGPVGVNEGMKLKSNLQWRLELSPDGTIGVQPKLKG